jgi:hypothetical protein
MIIMVKLIVRKEVKIELDFFRKYQPFKILLNIIVKVDFKYFHNSYFLNISFTLTLILNYYSFKIDLYS